MLTHSNLLHNLSLIHACFGHSRKSQGGIWLPPYHDMGLIGGILQPLYGGFPVTLLSPVDFLKRPIRWLQAISKYKATTSGGPKAAGKQTRDELVRRSFTEAVQWLSQRYGADPANWAWGKVHTVTFIAAPLGRLGPAWVRRAFNSKTMPARGDNYSVDGSSFQWSRPYEVVHGTAMRMIIDLSDFSKSVGVHTPGQSEHLYHPHRTDLAEMTQKVEFHPLLFTRQQVDAHAKDTLTLQPTSAMAKQG